MLDLTRNFYRFEKHPFRETLVSRLLLLIALSYEYRTQPRQNSSYYIHSFFLVKTSNYGAEAERCYMFLRCEAKNAFKMLITYMV